MATSNDDEVTAEADEPPDRKIKFSKIGSLDLAYSSTDLREALSPHSRKASLLTQALLTSPDLTPMSDVDAPHLTSDGGLTSPARTTTPSPPLPAANYSGLPSLQGKNSITNNLDTSPGAMRPPQASHNTCGPETKVEETLGRKRGITFACGKTVSTPETSSLVAKPKEQLGSACRPNELPARRPCVLRFACPTKPTRTEPEKIERSEEAAQSPQTLYFITTFATSQRCCDRRVWCAR